MGRSDQWLGGDHNMAADDFTLTPTWVIPENPEYHNMISKSDSMKKEYFNISSTPTEKFKLKWDGLSDADFKTLYDHVKGRYGGYDLFAWLNANIPSYLLTLLGLTSENLSGRWVDGTFKFNPKAKFWTAEIIFEKDVT